MKIPKSTILIALLLLTVGISYGVIRQQRMASSRQMNQEIALLLSDVRAMKAKDVENIPIDGAWHSNGNFIMQGAMKGINSLQWRRLPSDANLIEVKVGFKVRPNADVHLKIRVKD